MGLKVRVRGQYSEQKEFFQNNVIIAPKMNSMTILMTVALKFGKYYLLKPKK